MSTWSREDMALQVLKTLLTIGYPAEVYTDVTMVAVKIADALINELRRTRNECKQPTS